MCGKAGMRNAEKKIQLLIYIDQTERERPQKKRGQRERSVCDGERGSVGVGGRERE